MKKTLLFTFGLLLFCTAEAKRPFFFVQMSDPQFGMFDDNRSFGRETVNLEQAIKAVNKLKPAFVVITGDFVHNGTDRAQIGEMKRCLGLFSDRIPVYLVPGNHDVGDASPERIAGYRADYGPDRHAFAYGGSYFIGIDTEVISEKRGDEEREQFEWLKAELSGASGYDHIVVFGHRPPFVNSPDEKDTYDNFPSGLRQKYLDLFVDSGVDLMLWGHLHANRIKEYSGIFHVISTSVGKPLGSDPVSGFQLVRMPRKDFDIYFCELGSDPEKIAMIKTK